MVIVASEMLAGGTGIGFYIWDSWNALNLRNVMSAIILIGIIGYILDYSFSYLQRRFQR
jgi:nitrate/nitrite transport system permease protein